VQPTTEAFQAAASNADWAERRLLRDHRPAGRYVVADHGGDLHPDAQGCDRQKASQEAIKFFKWSFEGRQRWLKSSFIPMPDSVVKLIEDLVGRDQGLSK
jgi:phosphate transport system substrate-binding protein